MASRVGNYLLFETLGEGAFGKVKLGVHEQTGEQVAVKIMDKSDIKAQEMTLNVRREIAIMKALKHRNIVNLRQVLTSQSKLYIVMDLVTGGELFTKILKEGKLPETTARHYFQQLVDGIEYCHRRGVCHRDLKPENLLIDETTGELKITDFGLSAMKGASTTEELLHTQCGSPNYCAPEIIARHKQGYSGTKVDAWSCGIILFALLAGYLPFYDENTKVLYRMIQRDDVKFPKRFPSEAKDLILRLLHKEPDQRFTLVDVKKHPWFLIGYDGGESSVRSGTTSASPPTSGRRRRGRHARKSSVDQVPRAADLAVRKKSAKMDGSSVPRFAQGADGNAPLPPPHPAPPAIIDPSSPHLMPVSSPPKSPATGVSPPLGLPPIPPPPMAPPHSIPAPPLTLYSPPGSTASGASSQPATTSAKPVLAPVPAYPVPPYPGTDVASKVHRDPQLARRDGSHVGTDHAQPGTPLKTIVDGSHVPRFPPPPASMKAVAASVPPPPPMPPTSPPTVRRRSDGALDTGGASLPPSARVPVEGASETDAASSSSSVQPGSASPSHANVEQFKAPPSGPNGGKSRWNVNVLPPPPSYSAAKAPVTTSPLLADGDSSWQRNAPQGGEASDGNGVALENATDGQVGNGKSGEVDDKPLSLVERRKILYNSMAGTKGAEKSTTLPSKRSDGSIPGGEREGSEDSVEPRSAPGMRFGDRGEMQMKTAYPTMESAALSPLPVLGETDGALAGEGNTNPLPNDGVLDSADCGVNNGTRSRHGDDDAGSDAGEDDEKPSAEDPPLKERLAAAVARYRRIFRLGAMIGITSSPSFTSNKDNGGSDGEGDEEAKKSATGRSDFFSKAKGVTGAWGIILSQELEEDSDTEDERPLVTEAELQAFSRLLDFWDNRRASANVPAGSEVILDDEDTSPLSEEDITNIQSLLQKLEPKPVEDEVTEIADESVTVAAEVKDHRQKDSISGHTEVPPSDASMNLNVANASLSKGGTVADGGSILEEGSTLTKDGYGALGGTAKAGTASVDSQEDGMRRASGNSSSGGPPIPPPPPPPPAPPVGRSSQARGYVPPAPPPPMTPAVTAIAASVRERVVPPPPPAVCARPNAVEGAPWERTKEVVQVGLGVGPRDGGVDCGVDSAANGSASTKGEDNSRRLVVTPSTVRDPFRPRPPPVYPMSNDNDETDELEIGASGPKVRIDADSVKGGGRGENYLREKDSVSSVGQKRKSSANMSEMDMDGRKTISRDSGRMHSGASGVSDGSGGGSRRRGHMRTPSRDEHATRGLFTFNMFNRRKSSAMTSFDSELAPEDCLYEIGKILMAMGCTVLMKKGENKMKCEAPIKHETLKISITCSQESNVSTVHLKKGKRDKSQVDAKEFYEFFQVVHARFHERVTSHEHEQS